MGLSIYTNHQARPVLSSNDLTAEELAEFDYYDADAMQFATFFRYKGNVYDMGEFMRCELNGYDQPEWSRWDGYSSDTYFSGVLIKHANNYDAVIVARYCS